MVDIRLRGIIYVYKFGKSKFLVLFFNSINSIWIFLVIWSGVFGSFVFSRFIYWIIGKSKDMEVLFSYFFGCLYSFFFVISIYDEFLFIICYVCIVSVEDLINCVFYICMFFIFVCNDDVYLFVFRVEWCFSNLRFKGVMDVM